MSVPFLNDHGRTESKISGHNGVGNRAGEAGWSGDDAEARNERALQLVQANAIKT